MGGFALVTAGLMEWHSCDEYWGISLFYVELEYWRGALFYIGSDGVSAFWGAWSQLKARFGGEDE